MARRHALDSLAAVHVLESFGDRRIVDFGTGAGWPGLPLAASLPHRSFLLIDGTRKKIDVVREAAARMGLSPDRVECRWARLEQLPPEELEDAVLIARAVGPVERLIRWLPQLREISMVLWKGPAVDAELAKARHLLDQRELRITQRIPYRIPEDPAPRELVILERSSTDRKPR